MRIGAGGAIVEEDYIRLDALGVEYACRQPQYRVQVGIVQQLAADRLARAALEQHIVGHDNGGAAGRSQHRADVLHEVQLLVRGRRPEILAVVRQVFGFLLAFLVGETHRALLAERRIGEDVIESERGRGDQRVCRRYYRFAGHVSDSVQEEIHQAEPARIRYDLVAVKGFVLQEALFVPVERAVFRVGEEIVGGEKETAGAAGRVSDLVLRLGENLAEHSFLLAK